MAPSPTSDRVLLMEHEYYNTGDIRLVLPFMQYKDDSDNSLAGHLIKGIVLFMIIGLFINKWKSLMLHVIESWYR